MHLIFILVEFVLSVIMSFTSIIIVKLIYNLHFRPKPLIVYILLNGFISTVLMANTDRLSIYIKFSIMYSSLIIFLMLIFKLSLVKSIIAVSLFSFLEAVGNVLASVVFFVLQIDYLTAKNNLMLLLIAHFVIISVNISAFIIIRAFKILSPIHGELKARMYILNIVFIIFSLIIISVNMYYFFDMSNSGLRRPAIAINAVLILAYFIFALLNTSSIINQELQRQELDYHKLYNKTLEALTADLRKFKHKYDNDLSVIGGYIKLNNLKGLETYYNDLVKESRGSVNINSMALLNIKDSGILGLFSAEMDYAEKLGVAFKADVRDDLCKINMKLTHLCEVLGILFDNAIEAASESQEKLVNVMVMNSGKEITFCIENTTLELPDTDKIFIKGFSTKGKGRGFGLWQVWRIVNSYDNIILNTSINKNVFKQELIISLS